MVTTFELQEPAPRVLLASAVALMVHYFDVSEVEAWQEALHLANTIPPNWIRAAVLEALYQGRYKVVSVKQILDLWQRRGRILSHFNHEFEALVTVPLPGRIQSQLRALAQAHQQEHRQQREGNLRIKTAKNLKYSQTSQASQVSPSSPPSQSSQSSQPFQPIESPQQLETLNHLETLNGADPAHHVRGETFGPKVSSSPQTPGDSALPLSPVAEAQAVLRPEPNAPIPPFTVAELSVPPLVLQSLHQNGIKEMPPATPSPGTAPKPRHIDQFCPLHDPSELDRKLLALMNQV